jgi:hypothetical protein
METFTSPNRDTNHRFPAEIISHGVWLSDRFCLSESDVGELLFVRGVIVSYEAIRKWCRKLAGSTPTSSGGGAPDLATISIRRPSSSWGMITTAPGWCTTWRTTVRPDGSRSACSRIAKMRYW